MFSYPAVPLKLQKIDPFLFLNILSSLDFQDTILIWFSFYLMAVPSQYPFLVPSNYLDF